MAARKASRKTARKPAKKATRKTTKRTAGRAAAKATASTKRAGKITAAPATRTKSDVFRTISEQVGISRKDVSGVFETLGEIMAADLSKRGPGIVNVGGLMKVTVQRKPATKARKGINPFTGEPTVFKAKPARNVVKVRPLKSLKDMV